MTRMTNMIAVVAAVGMSGYLLMTQMGPQPASSSPRPRWEEADPVEYGMESCLLRTAVYKMKGDADVTLRVERPRQKDWIFPTKLQGWDMQGLDQILYRLESEGRSELFVAMRANGKVETTYLFPVQRSGRIVQLPAAKMLPVGFFGFYDQVMSAPVGLESPAPKRIFAPGLARYTSASAGAEAQAFDLFDCEPDPRAFERSNDEDL